MKLNKKMNKEIKRKITKMLTMNGQIQVENKKMMGRIEDTLLGYLDQEDLESLNQLDFSKKVNKPEEGALEFCMRAFKEASDRYEDPEEQKEKHD